MLLHGYRISPLAALFANRQSQNAYRSSTRVNLKHNQVVSCTIGSSICISSALAESAWPALLKCCTTSATPCAARTLRANALTEALQSLGANVAIGHREENLAAETDVVVVSSAISAENPELLAAKRRKIPVIPRAEMLSELMRMKYGVAVAGSHGKTTTTSMTAKLLSGIGLDPTVIVGGRVLSQATGARVGQGEYLVAEADESDGSFCLLKPAIAIVTNIDVEHLSHYGSFGALEEAFARFMQSVPFYG